MEEQDVIYAMLGEVAIAIKVQEECKKRGLEQYLEDMLDSILDYFDKEAEKTNLVYEDIVQNELNNNLDNFIEYFMKGR